MSRVVWWLRIPAALPWPCLYALAAVIAWLLRRVVRFRRNIVQDNLRRCFPMMGEAEINVVAARHYREMTSAALEMFKLATLSGDELRQRVTLANPQLLHAELQAGRSVMLLAAHQGNWEWALQRVALEFQPFLCAYKPLRGARLDRALLQLRSRFGAQLVPAKGLLRAMLRTRRAHLTGLAADQMPLSSPARVWIEFMGQTTAFYPGPAEIALRHRYSAWFLAMRRVTNGYYEAEFQPIAMTGEAIDATEFTSRYARCVEQQLRRNPSDWAWGHRRWKLQAPASVPTPAVR